MVPPLSRASASPWLCPLLSLIVPTGLSLGGGRPRGSILTPICAARSKTALLEGLEVDQYMLGILIYIQKYVTPRAPPATPL